MPRVAVTGACGFIGSCLSDRLLTSGAEVYGIDNLSRRGSELNLARLTSPRFHFVRADLGDFTAAHETLRSIGPLDAVFHLAGQVAVTSSYQNPRRDFYHNAAASFHVIESVRQLCPSAYCLYASTNKVYGRLVVEHPVGMAQPLDPCTPYGVSKATGELYFTEYGRPEIGMTTCSLRQSCIYGYHQYGIEDQGWLAWFAIANLLGRPVTIYGDGAQVRDVLFIEDLVDLYLKCWSARLAGVYPVGGGSANAISVREGLERIVAATGREFALIDRMEARPGDQPYFVADLSWIHERRLDWAPATPVSLGLTRMVEWIRKNLPALEALHGSVK